MTKEKVIESIEELYPNLDKCVTDIVKARLNKDAIAEGRALFSMEGLIVACMQELSFIHDYLKAQNEIEVSCVHEPNLKDLLANNGM